MTVLGLIDAGGGAPGTIRLSSTGNLVLGPASVLDAHGRVLQVDSYGLPIDAENTGVIELTVSDGGKTNASHGRLIIDPGAVINLEAPDGVARGVINFNVPRTGETSGNVQISVPGPVVILGAAIIAVNGFWTYAPTDQPGSIVQDNGSNQPLNAAGELGIDQIGVRNGQFINNAEPGGVLNQQLSGELAGLIGYGSAFHLRPGVEIVSNTAKGNLTVQGDLDLSALRYGPGINPNVYGSGEPGVLVLRAGGNLNIYGSITDGFGPAPDNPQNPNPYTARYQL